MINFQTSVTLTKCSKWGKLLSAFTLTGLNNRLLLTESNQLVDSLKYHIVYLAQRKVYNKIDLTRPNKTSFPNLIEAESPNYSCN